MSQARTTVENVAAEEAQGHVATWKRAELVWAADEKHGHPPSLRFAVGGGAAVVETPGMSAASWRALAAAVASPSRSLVAREAGEGVVVSVASGEAKFEFFRGEAAAFVSVPDAEAAFAEAARITENWMQ